VAGRSADDFFIEGGGTFADLMARCSEGETARGEFVLRGVDGGHIPVALTLAKLLDQEGAHVGYTVCMLDVTERSQAAAELLREQRKLTDVVNVIGAGLALIDREHNIVWANKQLGDWFGGSETLTDRTCYSVYCSGHNICPDCLAERVFRGEPYAEMADAVPTADGVMRHFNHIATPVLGLDGEVTHVLKLTQDITDQTRKLFQLSRLRRIGEVMQGVLELDRLLHFILTCVTAGQALGFNRAVLFLTDEDRTFLKGRMGVGPGGPEEAHDIWRRISEEGRSLQDLLASYDHAPISDEGAMTQVARSISIPLADQDHIAVQCLEQRRALVVRDASQDDRVPDEFLERLGAHEFVLAPLVSRGELIGVIEADNLYSGRAIEDDDVEILNMFASQAALAITTADAYRRLRAQMRQLEEAYRELGEAQGQLVQRERLATIGKMAAHVAHEIRNPLVTIGGFGRLLLKDDSVPSTAREFASVIVDEVSRLENILRGVLDFTRPPQPVLRARGINVVIKRVLRLTRERAESQGVDIEVDVPDDLPRARIDHGQMSQVFLNIVQNALDAMPDGGRMSLKATASEAAVSVSVTNDGPPISEEDLPGLFDPFYTTKKGGTGLGLAVSQKIVHDHRGEIGVTSDAANGTCFTVVLPLRGETSAEPGDDEGGEGSQSDK